MTRSSTAQVRRALRLIACLAATALLQGCVVPKHMHVTEGTAPQNVDTNVRFRTTYYFRVFDYCWAANAETGNGKYQDIIPETDTLYRYRMTGKASALGSRIKFESGVLPKSEIEPFGTDVVYNSDINGFLRRTPEEAKEAANTAQARRDADDERAGALARFAALSKMLAVSPAPPLDVQTALETAMNDTLADYTGKLRAPMGTDEAAALEEIRKSIETLTDKVTSSSQAATPEQLETFKTEVLRQIEADVDELRKAIGALTPAVATTPPPTTCPLGDSLRKGFQIMGPEGMRPYDQNERLIMAMSSSAKPLIETLNEYSGRILNAQRDPAAQLLPLARETTRIVETQRAVDGKLLKIAEGGDNPPSADEVFDTAISTFGEPSK